MKNRLIIVVIFCLILTSGFSQKFKNLKLYEAQTMDGLKYGFKDSITGEKVIKAQYDQAAGFSDGLSAVVLNKQVGFIDEAGKIVIPLQFVFADNFKDGYTIATKNGTKYGVINKQGNFVNQVLFDDFDVFTNGFARIVQNGKYGFINRQGKLIVPCKYELAENFEGGIAKVILKNDNPQDGIKYSHFCGFVNSKGIEIVKCEFYAFESANLKDGTAIICKDNEYPATDDHAVIDSTGKWIIPLTMKCKEIKLYSDFMKIKISEAPDDYTNQNFLYGIVDYSGKTLLPIKFGGITDFTFGTDDNPLAKVFYKSSSNVFFYITKKIKCVEYGGIKCPEE